MESKAYIIKLDGLALSVGPYTVHADEHGWSCDCKDFYFQQPRRQYQYLCKHIRMAIAELKVQLGKYDDADSGSVGAGDHR